MRALTWNLCTSFAALGTALAYAILALMFGWHWEYLPGALLGLLATYAVSTALGAKFDDIGAGRSLLAAIVLGCAAAVLTLSAGALAIGIGNFGAETTREILAAPAGQPVWNRVAEFTPDNAFDLILVPLLIGVLFGAIPALFLGLVFGLVLYARRESTGEATSGLRAWVGGGASLVVVLLAGAWLSMYENVARTTGWLADSPTLISDCGEIALSGGVLAYCRGVPCTEGRCDYKQPYDAFAIHVTPPTGAGWSWAGGGIGSTKRLDEIGHSMYWVQREANGFLSEDSPRHHQRHSLRLTGGDLIFGDRVFPFQPGMLLVVRYSEDWSYTVHHGAEAQRESHLSVDALQRALDETCAAAPGCKQPFQLKAPQN